MDWQGCERTVGKLARRDIMGAALATFGGACVWPQSAVSAATLFEPAPIVPDSPPVPASGERVVVQGQTPSLTLQTWLDLFGRPTAEVFLNGRGPFRFVVDTGSNASVVSVRVARDLALPELPARNVHGVTGVSMTRFAHLARIETGRSVSENLAVAVLDTPAMERLDGILGMDMFRDRRIRFNFARKTVELEPAAGGRSRGGAGGGVPVTASVRLRHNLLIEAEGRVGGVRTRCVLDTGSDTTLVNGALMRALTNPRRRIRDGDEPPVIMGVTNHEYQGVWAALPEIDMIGLRVRRLTAIAADVQVFRLWELTEQPAMLVGMDVLSRVETLTIDYRRRQVQLRMLADFAGGTGGGLG